MVKSWIFSTIFTNIFSHGIVWLNWVKSLFTIVYFSKIVERSLTFYITKFPFIKIKKIIINLNLILIQLTFDENSLIVGLGQFQPEKQKVI